MSNTFGIIIWIFNLIIVCTNPSKTYLRIMAVLGCVMGIVHYIK